MKYIREASTPCLIWYAWNAIGLADKNRVKPLESCFPSIQISLQ